MRNRAILSRRRPEKGVNSVISWFIPTLEQDREIALMRQAGVKWIRISQEWKNIEWADNTYSWDDTPIDKANAAGLKIAVVIYGTPPWARSGGTHETPPTNTQTYADFCGAYAARYAGKVQAIGVWNEPNTTRFWTGTAATYVDMLGKAYTAIKAADPTIKVMSNTALLSSNYLTWIQDCYTAGMKGKQDAMGVHVYSDTGSAPSTAKFVRYRDVWAEQVTQGDLIPQWITEWGWNTSTKVYDPVDGDPWQTGVSEATQATYVQQAIQTFRSNPYVTHQFLYQIRNNPNNADADEIEAQMGLMKVAATATDPPAGGTLKPSYTAFQEA